MSISGKMSQPAKKPKTSVMTDKLKEAMQCPVCLKVPREGPVYQCERGHCLCGTCRIQLTECPICRMVLGQCRNLVVEQLLPEVPHVCKFSDDGCTFEKNIPELRCHEEDCPYRLVNCVKLKCDRQVSMAKMLEHIQKDHSRLTYSLYGRIFPGKVA